MTAPNPDVILNKANIALSRSQRIVASWLPPRTSEEQPSNTPDDQDRDNEEKEIFTPVPERLGLGAPLPAKSNGQDGTPNRGDGNLEENDKLKKQLLGRNYKRVLKERDATLASSRQKGSAAVSGAPVDNRGLDGPAEGKEEEDDDEDEEGRASLVGKKADNKKRKVDSAPGQAGTSEVEDAQHGDGSRAAPARGRKKKATSFLDEVLAERSKKKKKR